VASVGQIEKLYASYKDKAHFYVVYIREAHPDNSNRAIPSNKFHVEDPKTLEERRKVAHEFATALKVSLPLLVDTIDDQVRNAYQAGPDRLYVIDGKGKFALVGGKGPKGFRPAVTGAPAVLDKLLAESKLPND
jgi:hypothetical protein